MPTGVDPDHELVTALRQREPTAAETLLTAYGDRAYRLAVRIAGNQHDASESYHERFGRGAAMKYDAWVAKAAKQPIVLETVDFGPLGEKTSSAQLRALYTAEELVGRLVVAAVNLGTRNIAGFMSEVLVLGLPDEQGNVVLLAAERDVPLGGRVY